MNAINRITSPFAIAGLVLTLGFSLDAHAVNKVRTDTQISTGLCDAMLPAQDTALRRNATGLINVSNASVYIACSMQGEWNSPSGLVTTFAYFRNNTAVNQTVRCTLAAGSQILGFTSIAKSVVVAPGGLAGISWASPADFPATRRFSNMTCLLPPNVTAGEIVTRYYEDVGA